MDRDEFYQTIIAGIARYREDAFVGDLLAAIAADPDDCNYAYSLNKNQVASKKWLIEELRKATAGTFDTVYVLGGWYGVLSAMLLQDGGFSLQRVVSIDIDPACEDRARRVNRSALSDDRFFAVTGDVLALEYGHATLSTRDAQGHPVMIDTRPDLIINTSCEHLRDFDAWYGRIPKDPLLVLQSNDYFDCDEHVNCVADLAAFRDRAPMRELLFAGTLPRKRYSRFMLIGRK